MQIYGILLRFRGIFTENAWKTVEKQWKIVEFPRNSFLNLLPDDPFSRSFPVVFGRFRGHSWRKSENFREYRGKSENIGENHSISFHFIPLHYTFFPQYPDFMLYNIFPAIPQFFKPQMLNLTIHNKIVIFLFGSI